MLMRASPMTSSHPKAIWYQGESNVACNDEWPYMQGLNCGMNAEDCASYYSCQFPAMVDDWRSSFASGWAGTGRALTFLFVGLPAYVEDLPSTTYDQKNDTSLPLIRLAQRNASFQEHTYQTSLVDHGYLAGHIGSIHPMDKTPVGKRLMLAALEHAYGQDVVSAGPEPVTAAIVDGGKQLVLKFDPKTVAATGLLLRLVGSVRQVCAAGQSQIFGNPHTAVPRSQCGPATGFELGVGAGAGAGELTWHPIASLALSADKLSVNMPVPAAVRAAYRQQMQSPPPSQSQSQMQLRYLFADWPTPTVYNSESFLGLNGQLPTPPFTMPVS